MEGRAHVEFERIQKLVVGESEGCRWRRAAGNVHHNINTTNIREGRPNECVKLRAHRYIGWDCHSGSTQRSKFVGNLEEAVCPTRRKHNRRSRLAEDMRHGSTDPTRSTRDDRNLSGKKEAAGFHGVRYSRLVQRTTKVLPLGMIVENRLVVVVGGGEIGAAKAMDLTTLGARVRVVSPAFTHALTDLAPNPSIKLVPRVFQPSDLDDAWLVFAATNDARVQREVREAADLRRIFCVAMDDMRNASAWGLARVARGHLLVAISTHGAAPALSRLLREILEQVLPDDPTFEAIQALRAEWKSDGVPMGERFVDLVKRLAEGRLPQRDACALKGDKRRD